jgi:hypothetical protein
MLEIGEDVVLDDHQIMLGSQLEQPVRSRCRKRRPGGIVNGRIRE